MSEGEGRWRHWAATLDETPVARSSSVARRVYVPLVAMCVVVLVLVTLSPPFVCVRTPRGASLSFMRTLLWGLTGAVATACLTACGVFRRAKL